MITRQQYEEARNITLDMLRQAGIVLTSDEKKRIEVADFGLNDLKNIGLQIVTYINTERVCAKELVLTPYQSCPEHKHPPVGSQPGKEETFRCRWGEVYLDVPGETTQHPRGHDLVGRGQYCTVKHEIVLKPGEQYTLYPNTLHWFQAGPRGAIVSEFSTKSCDEIDVFTDPDVKRLPEVGL